MSVTYDDSNRQVVPRCLTYATACSLGLLRVNRRQEKFDKIEVKESDARKEWIENPRISTAVELVGEALIVRDFQSSDAVEAARYILSKTPLSSLLIRQLAGHFLEAPGSVWIEEGEVGETDAYKKDIRRLKKSVRNYAHNPIAWSDLSLTYATLGQTEKSKMAMRVAMDLGRNNRFILRSASRCFMHMGEPDRAVAVLNKSGLCALDPWIASAEIAISESAGLKSRCISKGRDLIYNNNLTPFSRSELALSIGTVEIESGSIRKAKRIIRQALIDPTENALAQTEWAASKFEIDFDDLIRLRSSVPASYEASAVHLYYRRAFEESLKAAEKWSRFQFLSSRPIVLSTFISSCMLNDDIRAIKTFDDALPAQRASPSAINNYSFALARIGNTDKAKSELAKALRYDMSIEDRLIISATSGFICFREGHVEKGREIYNDAVRGFELKRDYRRAAMATYFWAMEERRIKSQDAESKINEAKRLIERYNVFEFIDLAKKL